MFIIQNFLDVEENHSLIAQALNLEYLGQKH